MALEKNTIKGIGVLCLIGVLSASGFLIAKPQIEEALALQQEVTSVEDMTAIREVRLDKLEKEEENIGELTESVDKLLLKVPSEKSVTDIAAAVVAAMPGDITLLSFSHGELLPGPLPQGAPSSSLTAPEAPFSLTETKAKAKPSESGTVAEEAGLDVTKAKEEAKSNLPFSSAPFILEVNTAGFESLNNFLDLLQYQERLLVVTAVNATPTTATIYAYAFAGSSPQIEEWESPAEEEAE